jgi:hypothetical protein
MQPTIRQQYKMAALQGILATGEFDLHKLNDEGPRRQIAFAAGRVADAMIADDHQAEPATARVEVAPAAVAQVAVATGRPVAEPVRAPVEAPKAAAAPAPVETVAGVQFPYRGICVKCGKPEKIDIEKGMCVNCYRKENTRWPG